MAQRSKLHAIIVAETDKASLGAKVDFVKMQQKMRKIAEIIDFELVIHAYEKHSLNPQSFTTQLQRLKCQPNDVVWFYYAGHGFQATHYGTNVFPAFRVAETQFPLDWVHDVLKRAKPRFLITMYDACNWRNETPEQETILQSSIQERYKILFRRVKGNIKMASNTAGVHAYSWSDAQKGGFFTHSFLDALDEITTNKALSCNWDALLQLAKAKTSQLARNYQKIQIPYYAKELF
jgi:Caspase domain